MGFLRRFFVLTFSCHITGGGERAQITEHGGETHQQGWRTHQRGWSSSPYRRVGSSVPRHRGEGVLCKKDAVALGCFAGSNVAADAVPWAPAQRCSWRDLSYLEPHSRLSLGRPQPVVPAVLWGHCGAVLQEGGTDTASRGSRCKRWKGCVPLSTSKAWVDGKKEASCKKRGENGPQGSRLFFSSLPSQKIGDLSQNCVTEE